MQRDGYGKIRGIICSVIACILSFVVFALGLGISDSLDNIDPKDYYGTYICSDGNKNYTFIFDENGCLYSSELDGITSSGIHPYNYKYVSAAYIKANFNDIEGEYPALVISSPVSDGETIVLQIIETNPYKFKWNGLEVVKVEQPEENTDQTVNAVSLKSIYAV